jgi:hypothetical protein
MPRTIPRLTAADLDALRALEAGGTDIPPVSRYWLSVYELIDETPQGWCLTEHGREFLREPRARDRPEAVPVDDPKVLAAAIAAANAGNPPELRVGRRRRRRLPWTGQQP